jgi:type IV pilus assembly protein PilA
MQLIDRVKTQVGFSLVELMVVVGIIGLLAAIAVPQFSKFQARARQSEAKAMLSAIYSAEKVFFDEWNNYTSNMGHAGVSFNGNRMRYDGGLGEGGGICNNTPTTSGMPSEIAPVRVVEASNALVSGTAVFDSSAGMMQPVVITNGTGMACDNALTMKTFLAVVAGDPNSRALGSFDLDQWTINDRKAVVNIQNGIR